MLPVSFSDWIQEYFQSTANDSGHTSKPDTVKMYRFVVQALINSTYNMSHNAFRTLSFPSTSYGSLRARHAVPRSSTVEQHLSSAEIFLGGKQTTWRRELSELIRNCSLLHFGTITFISAISDMVLPYLISLQLSAEKERKNKNTREPIFVAEMVCRSNYFRSAFENSWEVSL